jgi:hypothetical protein
MKTIFFFYLTIALLSIRIGYTQSSFQNEIEFNKFKKQDLKYFSELSKMKKVFHRNVNSPSGEVVFSIYKRKEVSDNEFNYANGFLVVNEFYFPIELGSDYRIDIENIAGADKFPEIVFYTGCFCDIDGCCETLKIIRIISKSNITITDFGEFAGIASEKSDLNYVRSPRSAYSQADFLKDVKKLKNQGKFIVEGLSLDHEYIILNAYELSPNGFRKSSFIRKIKRIIFSDENDEY